MEIVGEYENLPSWVADWPHCCNFRGDSWGDLRWSAMVLKASKLQQIALFHHILWQGVMIKHGRDLCYPLVRKAYIVSL